MAKKKQRVLNARFRPRKLPTTTSRQQPRVQLLEKKLVEQSATIAGLQREIRVQAVRRRSEDARESFVEYRREIDRNIYRQGQARCAGDILQGLLIAVGSGQDIQEPELDNLADLAMAAAKRIFAELA